MTTVLATVEFEEVEYEVIKLGESVVQVVERSTNLGVPDDLQHRVLGLVVTRLQDRVDCLLDSNNRELEKRRAAVKEAREKEHVIASLHVLNELASRLVTYSHDAIAAYRDAADEVLSSVQEWDDDLSLQKLRDAHAKYEILAAAFVRRDADEGGAESGDATSPQSSGESSGGTGGHADNSGSASGS